MLVSSKGNGSKQPVIVIDARIETGSSESKLEVLESLVSIAGYRYEIRHP